MMKSHLLALGLATMLLAPAPARAAADDGRYRNDEALRHYLSGRWLEETGDLAGARAELARAMALDPDAVSIQLEACLVVTRLGDPEHALELARTALTHAPGNARALWLEGAALVSLSRPEDALAPLRMSVVADEQNAEAWRTLAHAAESLDRVELVDSCYARLVELDDEDAESWFQLATARARLGHFESADSALTVALEDNPARPGAIFLRGWIRERTGHAEEAIELYRRHLEAHAGDVSTRRRLVSLLARQGRVKEGLVEARRVTAALPAEPAVYQVQADLEFRDKRPEEAEATLTRMRALAPDDPDGIGRSIDVLVRFQRGPEAIALADQWVSARPDDRHGPMLRAWARESAGQLDSALAYARIAAAAEPDSQAPHRMLARYLRQTGHWREAIGELGRLRKLAPDDPTLLMDLGYCREQSGDLPGAIQAGRDALAMAPESPQTQNFLGFILADHDESLPEAEKLISKAVEQEPDNGAFIDSMGWVLFREGALDRARVQLERALTLTGGDPVIHEHLGDVYRELKLFELARQQYRESLAGDAGNQRVKGKLDAVR
jgi:tetratricopeptide (TPR) repeat protein